LDIAEGQEPSACGGDGLNDNESRFSKLSLRGMKMKVAAYQIPLSFCQSPNLTSLIAAKVNWCESHGIDVLCCPEGILGGLADYSPSPSEIAICVENGRIDFMQVI
jgi:hypothetical protein